MCYSWETFFWKSYGHKSIMSLNTVRGQGNKASVASQVLSSVHNLLYLRMYSGVKKGRNKV